MAISRFLQNMRIIHRYLGFFLAGIMAVYSLSGLVLVFRDTDLLKKEVAVHKTLASDLEAVQLGKELKIKNLKIEKEEGDLLIFKNGQYNQATGESTMIKKQLPYVLNQMTHLLRLKAASLCSF